VDIVNNNWVLIIVLTWQVLILMAALRAARLDRRLLDADVVAFRHVLATPADDEREDDDEPGDGQPSAQVAPVMRPPLQRLVRLVLTQLPYVPVETLFSLGESTLTPSTSTLKRAAAMLPLIGLLGTFVGIAMSLWQTSVAQEQLSALLQTTGTIDITAAGEGATDVESMASLTRSALTQQLSGSMTGLSAYVDGQRESMMGMAVAVSSTIMGVLLSLWVGRARKEVENNRKSLILELIDSALSEAELSQQDNTPTRANLIEVASQLVREVQETRNELLLAQRSSAEAVTSVQLLVQRIEPVATETQKATRMLNQNVDELNGAFQTSATSVLEATDRLTRATQEASGWTNLVQGSATNMSKQVEATGSVLRQIEQQTAAALIKFEERTTQLLTYWNERLVTAAESTALQGRLHALEVEIRGLRESTHNAIVLQPQTRVARWLQRLLKLPTH